MRVLVCGGRDFTDYSFFSDYMSKWLWKIDNFIPLTIISGKAKGVDTMAATFAIAIDAKLEEYPAEWSKYGRSAGYVRNTRMLVEGKPDLVIAFPGGKGTAMMVKLAKEAGVEVIEVEYNKLWTNCKTCGKLRDNTYGCYC